MKRFATIALLFVLLGSNAQAYQKVGNGDDGGDLEGATPLPEGPLSKAREQSVSRLTQLNTAGIRSLGNLIPEVAKTDLYFSPVDKAANLPSDQGSFHANMQGMVYARTFARPHAATRFFPAALTLSSEQMIALHIHEALHRSLPASVRENEAVVTQLTLSITTPGATRDQVEATVNTLIPEEIVQPPADGLSSHYRVLNTEAPYRRVSNLRYSFRQFLEPKINGTFPIRSMHVVQSDLYPFGGENTPFGMGLEASMIQSDAAGLQSGPLGISARLRLFQRAGFDVGIWGVASLNTLSTEELKNSPYGRSLVTFGLFIRKRLPGFYIENFLSYTLPGDVTQMLGAVSYNYSYGGVFNAKVRTGFAYSIFDFGAFTEMHLAQHFRVAGGAFKPFDTGSYRLVSVGPEVAISLGEVSLSVFGRMIIDSTQGANFDYLGNLMGAGTAQGSLGMAVNYAF
jgi:hypothetical protein